MVQCEMCGAETSSPRTAKIEGAELQVCADCADFGTEIDRGDDEEETTTKYSTGSSSSSSSSSGGSTSSSGGSSGGSDGRSRGDDMFRDVDQVVPDYDDRIRQARESAGLSQAELADQLNEKASFIRKLERGESLPNDTLQRKLERALEISLTSGGEASEDSEWSGEETQSGVTLGDVVKRKD